MTVTEMEGEFPRSASSTILRPLMARPVDRHPCTSACNVAGSAARLDLSAVRRRIFSASGLINGMAPLGSMDSTPQAQEVCNKSSKLNPERPVLGGPLGIVNRCRVVSRNWTIHSVNPTSRDSATDKAVSDRKRAGVFFGLLECE